jgi:cytochrome c-type biogenesis protein CcmF
MIPEIGHYALVLALALALVPSVVPLAGARARDTVLMGVGDVTALVQFGFVATAFAALVACYVTSDFSVMSVFENSHSTMPLIYKFTSVWGNHEGSMLLWVLILSLFGALVATFGNNVPLPLKATVLSVQSWVAAAFICSSSRPRTRSRVLRRRRSRGATSTPSCRTWDWRCIRRSSISAMSASRSRSPSRWRR